MSLLLSQTTIANLLEQRYLYGRQESHYLAAGLVQQQAIHAAASTLLQQPGQLPELRIGGYSLAGLVQQHSLVPLQALHLLARELQQPGSITLLLETGAERAAPFITSSIVRVYQQAEHYSIVSTLQRGGPLWNPVFITQRLVAQLAQPGPRQLAEAIRSAWQQSQTPASRPSAGTTELFSTSTPRCWQLCWDARQPHHAEVVIELEENMRHQAEQRARTPIWRLVEPAYRYLHAPAPFGMIAEWILCWETLMVVPAYAA